MDYLLEELKRLGANALNTNEKDIKSWQKLFGFSYNDARDKIQNNRADLERRRISDELWLDMKASKGLQGHNRESYEYELFRRSKVSTTTDSRQAVVSKSSLRGLLLTGPLATPEKVQTIAGLSEPPLVTAAESEEIDSSTSFCYVTAGEEQLILKGLCDHGIVDFQPCFITINIAAKDLHTSASPTLGLSEPTLPQHRPDSVEDLVQQDQYPVIYFFYGTLAQPEILKQVLELEDEVLTLQPAYVLGGTIETLGAVQGFSG
ncbi:hypothetical protein E4T42_00197 [Aureobasidium subglaciale]|nr:hypothetical protein E4T42_00197 [Aureobasidium subglaciale]